MRLGWSSGLVKEQDTYLETIGTQADFFYLFLFIGTCIKACKNRRNTLKTIFLLLFLELQDR